MTFDLLIGLGGLFGACLFLFSFFFQRFRWRSRRRRGKSRLGFYPTGASMGNAFQQLQTLAEPQMVYVLEEKLDEGSDEDEAGDPDDPDLYLRRQLRRLQRGEDIGRLTVYLRGNTP